jgi:sodium transport system ATP-binding protein
MKVALGRALVHSPQNLVLDEPTNGLDIPTARSFRDLLRSMRDAGSCIILSSHVLDDIRALCDRIVIIAHGSVVAHGTPRELCEQTGCSSLEDAYLQLAAGEVIAC